VSLEANLRLVAVPIDPEAARLVVATLDEKVRIIPRATTRLAPFTCPGVVVPIWPSDGDIGNADGIIIGREKSVCRLLTVVVIMGDLDLGCAPITYGTWVGCYTKEPACFVKETDIRQITARVTKTPCIVETNANIDGRANWVRCGEVIHSKLDDAKDAGYDSNDIDNSGRRHSSGGRQEKYINGSGLSKQRSEKAVMVFENEYLKVDS
jgi:hypothetical protein